MKGEIRYFFFSISEFQMQQTQILSEFIDVVRSLRALIIPEKLAETSDGVTLLEVKIHSILSYLTNLCFAMLLKVDGENLSMHPVVEQLATLRIIIEKTRPLELKLKYQIDKLVKAAAVDDDRARVVPGQKEEVRDDEEDELMHAPNPKALVNKKDEYKNAADVMKDAIYRYLIHDD
jgi:U3 small nucleolar ribonucleoprotein protein LCP5